MRTILFVLLMGLCTVGHATEEVPAPADLPSAIAAKTWIAQDPAVVEAQSARMGAGHAAGMLAASPNEWIVKGSAQRRNYTSGPASREWTAGFERTVRLPGKKRLDRQLGDTGIALADAQLGEAIQEAARGLVDLWMGRLSARQARAFMTEQVQLARSNLQSVQKRHKAGDAAALDVNVAAADLAEVEQGMSEALASETKAQARLNVRFPGAADAEPPMLGQPVKLEESEVVWKDRVLAASDPLRMAQLRMEQAELTASRARADRLPDPTIGLYAASEAFSRERIVGFNVSMPLPGSYRTERLGQALTEVDAARAARDRRQRELESEIADSYTDATSNYDRWKLAEEGASRTRRNAQLTQRAYALGEADLQALLLARRQSVDAMQSALDARTAALRSYYRLLVDARLIWGLARE
ncbi:TolC family protein [Rhodanobacter terrae]|uniref:TolC family protein n=1 Tax=Rhodanobacter terrae TaxID=418647 RepID=A0ABW0SSR8_9GAMM